MQSIDQDRNGSIDYSGIKIMISNRICISNIQQTEISGGQETGISI